MLVGDICTKSLITVESSAISVGVARLMNKHGIHSLIVVENSEPVGVVTKSDLIKRVMVKQIKNPEKCKVSEFMTKALLTVQEDASVFDACQTMAEHGVRHLLVVKKPMDFAISRLASVNKFDLDVERQILPPMVGVISIVDILKNLPKLMLS